MKNSNDTIGNRTRNLPGCSVVPQPTAQPRVKTEQCTITGALANYSSRAVRLQKCTSRGITARVNYFR